MNHIGFVIWASVLLTSVGGLWFWSISMIKETNDDVKEIKELLKKQEKSQ